MSDDKTVRPAGVVGKTRKLAALGIRLAQLGGARVAATAAEAMRRKAKELEIRLDGLHKGLDIKPVSDVAFPKVDLASQDPVAQIIAAPEIEATKAYFYKNPAARFCRRSSQRLVRSPPRTIPLTFRRSATIRGRRCRCAPRRAPR